MKKVAIWLAVAVLFVYALSGCGAKKSHIAGMWYSDGDEKSVLSLKDDGTYTDGTWFTKGDYSVDGDTITMTGELDGATTLQIQSINRKTVLVYEDGQYSHTYYDNAEDAKTAREVRQAKEQREAEQKQNAEKKALEDCLVGYWCSSFSSPIEFTSNGKYITYDGQPENGRKELDYEIISGNTILIKHEDGTTQSHQVTVVDENCLNIYNLSGPEYIRAVPHDLTIDLLVGEWKDEFGREKIVFSADGTYTEVSPEKMLWDDTVATFAISSTNTIDVHDQYGTIWAVISETENEYQLFLNKPSSTFSSSKVFTKSK